MLVTNEPLSIELGSLHQLPPSIDSITLVMITVIYIFDTPNQSAKKKRILDVNHHNYF
jgi:hypothetical protein